MIDKQILLDIKLFGCHREPFLLLNIRVHLSWVLFAIRIMSVGDLLFVWSWQKIRIDILSLWWTDIGFVSIEQITPFGCQVELLDFQVLLLLSFLQIDFCGSALTTFHLRFLVRRILRAGGRLKNLVAFHLGIVEVVGFVLMVILGLSVVLKFLHFVIHADNISVMLDLLLVFIN